MEFEVKAPIDLEDGNHTGEIFKVVERKPSDENKYHYVDVWIRVDDKEVELKYGCPANVSEKSKLGRLLISFGFKLIPGEVINPETVLLNKKCKFMTMKKPGKDGMEFSEIVDDSLKPLGDS